MDFSKELMVKNGHGSYEHLELPKDLPILYLAYSVDASDSGKIHSNVRKRFDEGEQVINDET